MNVYHFLDYVRDVCETYGINLNLIDSEYININGTPCSGGYDGKNKVLTVATGKPKSEWIVILAHEFSHLKQHIENAKVWTDCFNTCLEEELDCVSILDLWLSYDVELTKEQLQKYINTTIMVELDCEQRTIEWIEKFNLPIDKEQYIKQANSYLLFYQAVRYHRKWCIEGRPPRKNKKLMNLMSSEFDYQYDQKLSTELLEAYTWCFDNNINND